MATISKTFSFDSERDREILRFIDSKPKNKRSEHVRAALRRYVGNQVSLGDLYQELAEIKEALQRRAVLQGSGAADVDGDAEDPRIARARRKLGDLGL